VTEIKLTQVAHIVSCKTQTTLLKNMAQIISTPTVIGAKNNERNVTHKINAAFNMYTQMLPARFSQVH